MAKIKLREEVTIWEYEKGLFYRDGKLETVLEAGRYVFWIWEWRRIRIVRVSTRLMSQVISGQEILTADRVEVRLSLVAQYQVTDPALAINSAESYTDQLYQELQLTLRDLVAGYTIDALLEARGKIGDELLEKIAPLSLAFGVTLKRVGVRDIVLPHQVKRVFMLEVEADREGRADLVKARHEVAAARARANTAKILAENPNVARMEELNALVKLAGQQGNLVLLPNLADLFLPRNADTSTPPNGN